jgi:hypothetical protein
MACGTRGSWPSCWQGKGTQCASSFDEQLGISWLPSGHHQQLLVAGRNGLHSSPRQERSRDLHGDNCRLLDAEPACDQIGPLEADAAVLASAITRCLVRLERGLNTISRNPIVICRGLAAILTVLAQQVPNGDVLDEHAPAGPRNTHARVVLDEPACRYVGEETVALRLAHRLRGES